MEAFKFEHAALKFDFRGLPFWDTLNKQAHEKIVVPIKDAQNALDQHFKIIRLSMFTFITRLYT